MSPVTTCGIHTFSCREHCDNDRRANVRNVAFFERKKKTAENFIDVFQLCLWLTDLRDVHSREIEIHCSKHSTKTQQSNAICRSISRGLSRGTFLCVRTPIKFCPSRVPLPLPNVGSTLSCMWAGEGDVSNSEWQSVRTVSVS